MEARVLYVLTLPTIDVETPNYFSRVLNLATTRSRTVGEGFADHEFGDGDVDGDTDRTGSHDPRESTSVYSSLDTSGTSTGGVGVGLGSSSAVRGHQATALMYRGEPRLLLVGTQAGGVVGWRTRPSGIPDSQTPAMVFRGHRGYITTISYHEHRKLVVTASADRTVRIWDWSVPQAEKITVQMLVGHTGTVSDFVFHQDVFVTASTDGTLRVWAMSARRGAVLLYPKYTTVQTIKPFAIGSGTLMSPNARLSIAAASTADHDEQEGMMVSGEWLSSVCFGGRLSYGEIGDHIVAGDLRGRLHAYRTRSRADSERLWRSGKTRGEVYASSGGDGDGDELRHKGGKPRPRRIHVAELYGKQGMGMGTGSRQSASGGDISEYMELKQKEQNSDAISRSAKAMTDAMNEALSVDAFFARRSGLLNGTVIGAGGGSGGKGKLKSDDSSRSATASDGGKAKADGADSDAAAITVADFDDGDSEMKADRERAMALRHVYEREVEPQQIHRLGVIRMVLVQQFGSNSFILSIAHDGECLAVDLESNEILHRVRAEFGQRFTDVVWMEETKEILLVDTGGLFYVFNTAEDAMVLRSDRRLGPLLAIQLIRPEHGEVAVASRTHVEYISLIRHEAKELVAHDAGIVSVCKAVGDGLGSSDKLVFSADAQGTVKCWDPYDMSFQYAITNKSTAMKEINALVYVEAMDRHVVCTGDESGWVSFYVAESGGLVRRQKPHENVVTCAAGFNLAGRPHVITASFDGTIAIWNLGVAYHEFVRLSSRMNAHSCEVLCVASHPEGDVFATGGNDGLVKVWGMTQNYGRTLLCVLMGATESITAICFYGEAVYAGCEDRCIYVWGRGVYFQRGKGIGADAGPPVWEQWRTTRGAVQQTLAANSGRTTHQMELEYGKTVMPSLVLQGHLGTVTGIMCVDGPILCEPELDDSDSGLASEDASSRDVSPMLVASNVRFKIPDSKIVNPNAGVGAGAGSAIAAVEAADANLVDPDAVTKPTMFSSASFSEDMETTTSLIGEDPITAAVAAARIQSRSGDSGDEDAGGDANGSAEAIARREKREKREKQKKEKERRKMLTRMKMTKSMADLAPVDGKSKETTDVGAVMGDGVLPVFDEMGNVVPPHQPQSQPQSQPAQARWTSPTTGKMRGGRGSPIRTATPVSVTPPAIPALISCSTDGTIRLWSIKKKQPVFIKRESSDKFRSMDIQSQVPHRSVRLLCGGDAGRLMGVEFDLRVLSIDDTLTTSRDVVDVRDEELVVLKAEDIFADLDAKASEAGSPSQSQSQSPALNPKEEKEKAGARAGHRGDAKKAMPSSSPIASGSHSVSRSRARGRWKGSTVGSSHM